MKTPIFSVTILLYGCSHHPHNFTNTLIIRIFLPMHFNIDISQQTARMSSNLCPNFPFRMMWEQTAAPPGQNLCLQRELRLSQCVQALFETSPLQVLLGMIYDERNPPPLFKISHSKCQMIMAIEQEQELHSPSRNCIIYFLLFHLCSSLSLIL